MYKTLDNYEITVRKNCWTGDIFHCLYDDTKAVSDGRMLIAGIEPDWDAKIAKELPPNLKKTIANNESITFLPNADIQIEPRFIYSNKKGKWVFFSNGAPIQKIYYDGILSLMPNAKFFSSANTSTHIEAKDGDNRAFVMPFRLEIPEEMRGEFPHLVVDWFGYDYDSFELCITKSLYYPSVAETNVNWFSTEADRTASLQNALRYAERRRKEALREIKLIKKVLGK